MNGANYPTFMSLFGGAGSPSPASSQTPMGAGGVGSGVMGQDPNTTLQAQGTGKQDMGASPWAQHLDMWSQINQMPGVNIGGGK